MFLDVTMIMLGEACRPMGLLHDAANLQQATAALDERPWTVAHRMSQPQQMI